MPSDFERLMRLQDRMQRVAFILRGVATAKMSADERKLYSQAVELLTRAEDDRCSRCFRSDADGCNACGPNTHRMLYG